MPRSDHPSKPAPAADPAPPAPVSRRKFLTRAAALAAAAPALGALAGVADAATRHERKHAPAAPSPAKPEPTSAGAGAHPDWSVAKTPAEREALEKQWKQMVELVAALRKTPVPVGAEFATGALAPRRLRREAN